MPASSSASIPSGGVALVSVPFGLSAMPSIALGLLTAKLREAGLACRTYNVNLDFLPYIASDLRDASGLYDEIAYLWDYMPGEWLFSPSEGIERDLHYLRKLATALPDRRHIIELLARLRGLVPTYVERCAELIASGNHDIVGFSSSFMQTQPGMRIAQRLKELTPGVRVIFGGSNAFGPMGTAVLRRFDCVDVVAHGEADDLIVPLVRALRGEPSFTLEQLPDISYREGGTIRRNPGGQRPGMDSLPVPDYVDYFADLRRLEECHGESGLPDFLPVETARGCWWGQRSHCTFCGLNADRMAFRSRGADSALRLFDTLHERHGFSRFYAVDNILDEQYFETVLPALAGGKRDYFIHYEIKSNLRRSQVEALAAAGVRKVQPGIESLSTPILKLMRKGVSAIHNIQTLKWLTEHGMRVTWYILYGFPKETREPYEDMIRLIPRLMHLCAPSEIAPIFLERFSPYHMTPEKFGIRITGPSQWYVDAFPQFDGALLNEIAYRFDFVEDGRDPQLTEFIEARLVPLAYHWKSTYGRDGCTLFLLRGPRAETAIGIGPPTRPEKLILVDGPATAVLRATESVVPDNRLDTAIAETERTAGAWSANERGWNAYLRAHAPAVVDQRGCAPGTARAALQALEDCGIILREGPNVLALPVDFTGRLFRHKDGKAHDAATRASGFQPA